MACYSAIEKKGIVLSPDKTVKKALKLLKKNKVAVAPVIGEEGKFLGVFSMSVLLKNLIPVPITTSSGVQIDMKLSAAPGVGRRLIGILQHKVAEVVERKSVIISPDAPLWEAVGRLTTQCEPLCVVDKNGKFMGLITYESLIDELENSAKD